jgi:hypothetical protein
MQAADAAAHPGEYTGAVQQALDMAYAGDHSQAALYAQAAALFSAPAQQRRSARGGADRPKQDTPPSGESYGGTTVLPLPATVSPICQSCHSVTHD